MTPPTTSMPDASEHGAVVSLGQRRSDRGSRRPASPTSAGSAATASSAPERATALLMPLAIPACPVRCRGQHRDRQRGDEAGQAEGQQTGLPERRRAQVGRVRRPRHRAGRCRGRRPSARRSSGPGDRGAQQAPRPSTRARASPPRWARWRARLRWRRTPRSPGSCRTRKNSTDPSAPYTRNVIMFAAENTRDRNIDNGAIASRSLLEYDERGGRRQREEDADHDHSPTKGAPRGQQVRRDAQGHRTGQRARYVEPPQCTVSSRDSGTRRPISTTSAHSGRLIAKIQRQPAWSTRNPPMSGPMAVATPEAPAHVPMAAGRSSGRNDAWMRASAPGTSRAAATPCSTRNSDQLDGRLGECAQRAAEGEAPPRR